MRKYSWLCSFHSALIALLLVSLTAFAKQPQRPESDAQKNEPTSQGLDYTTSWIGNTFGGYNEGPNHQFVHVSLGIDAMYVTPDGHVYTNVGWDEGGRGASVFQNGQLLSPLSLANNSPNFYQSGGPAIVADNKYFYASETTGCPGGCGVRIVNKNSFTDSGLQLTGSNNVYNTLNILGLALSQNGLLYVSENDTNTVEVFDTTTPQMALVHSFPISNPVKVAVDGLGGFWVSHRDPTPLPALNGHVYDNNGHHGLPNIDHYDSNGNWLGSITLPTGGEVSVLTIINGKTLLVGDEGPEDNIKIYSNITTKPVLSGTYGQKGGVYAEPDPGKLSPQRFHSIDGIGTDDAGNIYVAERGGPGNSGADVRSYSLLGGTLNWEVESRDWISLGTPDPKNDKVFYDAFHKFSVDYSQPPGKEATVVADTYDRFKYPDDIRVTGFQGRGEIHYIAGHKFLFTVQQAAVNLAIYRFEKGSEIAIPCGGFDYGSFQMAYQDWDIQPLDGEFIWRDLVGDGQLRLTDFIEPPNNSHRDGANFFVDNDGDVWQVNYNSSYENSIHIRRYAFQGLDSFGSPVYDFNHVTIYNALTDFPELSNLNNMAFFPNDQGGTLYVYGNDANNAPQVARYDHWDWNVAAHKATWLAPIPFNNISGQNYSIAGWQPAQFTVAGDFVFFDFQYPHYNLIFNANTGAYVGRFVPGANVGGTNNVGNTDMSEPNFAYKRKNDEYLLFQEDDYGAKILMYRWIPPSPLPPPPPPPPAPAPPFLTLADDKSLTLTLTPESHNKHVVGYAISQSPTSGGPYTVLQNGITNLNAPITLHFPQNGTSYYVASVQVDTGLSSNSTELKATTIPYGTTYEAESGALFGCAGIFPGPQDSAGARVGCLPPGSGFTLNVTVATAGTYAMRLYYGNGDSNACTSDPAYIDLSINGSSQLLQSPCLPFTGDYSIPGYVTWNVPLNAGANVLTFGNPSTDQNGSPDIDRIVLPATPNQ